MLGSEPVHHSAPESSGDGLPRADQAALTQELPDVPVDVAEPLPSVGPGQVLEDIISTGAGPVVRLTKVFRRAAASSIVVNAHRVNRGETPELNASPAAPSAIYFVEIETPEEGLAKIIQIVAEHIPSASTSTPSGTCRCSAR